MIVVEQDIGQAMAVADRVYCMMEGRVTLEGRAAPIHEPIEPRGDPQCLFRSSRMIWVDTIIQGILLGTG
jgi:energy-coupling factor transporter ATP-binding protein EcfA2